MNPSRFNPVPYLEWLCPLLGLEYDHSQAIRAVEHARPLAAQGDIAGALIAAGNELGMRVTPVRRSLRQVMVEATPSAPWVTLADGGWGILEAKGSKVRAVRPGDPGTEWIPASEFCSRIGVGHLDEQSDWVTAEPSAPLEDMRGHHATPWQRLRGLLRAEQADLFVVIVYSVAIGLLSLVVPVAVQWLVNTIAFGTLVQPLIVLTIFVLVALGFASVLTAMRSWVVELMQQRLFVRVASDVAFRLPRVKVEAFDKVHGPELVNRFFDVVTVQKSASVLLVEGLSILLQTVIGMLLLAVYHPLLLVFDIILLVIILVILFPLARGAERTAIQESRAKYALVAWFEEIARYPVTFKSGAGQGYGSERSDVLVRSYLAARRSHFRIVMRQIAGFLTLQAIASAALLGIGGWLVMERQLTLGQLVAAELVVTMLVGGLSKFAKILETFYDMLAALDKLGYLIDLPLERGGGERLPASPFPARLALGKVTFGFPGKGAILHKVSIEIAPGGRVGLVGTLGSGKSSLVDLLYGLRFPQSGSIQIDGHDYRDLSMEDLRSHVVVVRSNEIFEGTVTENLRIGREHLSAADLWRALRAVGLEEDVQALPDGLSTELATGGQPLSRGQSGRLMVARALAGHPRLLILDESLDRIDDDHDREVLFSALFAPGSPWTLLVVSSSPEILSRCDRVLALNGGEITEIGSSARNPVRE